MIGLWRQWHQLDHIQTICTLLQTDDHINASSLNFYGPNTLPDAHPTVSKYSMQSDLSITLITVPSLIAVTL